MIKMCPWNECSILRHGGCFFPLLVNKFPSGSFTVWKNYNKKEDMRKLALLYNQLLNLFIVYCVVGNICTFSIHINRGLLAVFHAIPQYFPYSCWFKFACLWSNDRTRFSTSPVQRALHAILKHRLYFLDY